MEQLQDLLWIALAAVVTTAVPILVKLLADLIKAKIAEAKDQYPSEFDRAIDIISVIVRAAEQMGASEAIDDKLDWAVETAESWLTSKGIDFDLDQIRVLIEAEVKRQFGKTEPVE